ncbi:hypothetical protein Sjap_014422 [Stephania japonica]|uniref:Uncharacterized protein n=1 Tax=Stephania japonica TaxID=461633 RepID=A0AAP0IHM9_9MAGN
MGRMVGDFYYDSVILCSIMGMYRCFYVSVLLRSHGFGIGEVGGKLGFVLPVIYCQGSAPNLNSFP